MLCVEAFLPALLISHHEYSFCKDSYGGYEEQYALHKQLISDIEQDKQVMSMQSDEDTLDRQSILTLQTLLKESRIKDIALSKATHLIDLLTLELQAQRTKREQQLTQLEQELRQQFQRQLSGLLQKNQFLQRQLKRFNAINKSNNFHSKTVQLPKRPIITRTNSSNSLSVKRKKSNNKRYTEINNQENNAPRVTTLQLKALQEYLVNYQEWKEAVVDELNEIALNDSQQLRQYLDRGKQFWLQIDDTFSQPVNPYIVKWLQEVKEESEQLRGVISQQQKLINELRVHMQEQQDVYKHTVFKLVNSKIPQDKYFLHIDMHNVLLDIKMRLGEAKRLHQKKHLTLQEQNNQLKNILDSIISLVQNQRKNQF